MSERLLQVRGLAKHFQGLRAVDDVSFDVARGELVGLIGPNGAGKTTLFNCVAGAIARTSGDVEFQGRSIAGLDPGRIARLGIARTYQNLRIFPDITVFDNVSAGAIGRLGISLFGTLIPGVGRKRDEAIADAALAALERFDLLPSRTSRPAISPTARRSISRSPARWRCSPPCCSSTSRPPASTTPRPASSRAACAPCATPV
jgi:branched-chain amino acid transport system ATP-binding protein